NAAGNTSTTDAPTKSDGPAFDTTTVYVTGVPGPSHATPSDLVIDKSAVAPTSVVSVAVLLDGVGSTPVPGMATEAVFDSAPPNAASIVAVRVNVAVPPAATSTVVEMLPDPPRSSQPDP